MDKSRNSIVINNIDMYAFAIQAICEGYGFFGSPKNTEKKAAEKLPLILKQAGITKEQFDSSIKNLYQNIMIYDNIHIGQQMDATFWLTDIDNLYSINYGFREGVDGDKFLPSTYNTFSINNPIPFFEYEYLEILKPFVVSLVHSELLLNESSSSHNHPMKLSQKKILFSDNITLLDYIELVYDNIFYYANSTPYLVYFYQRECNFPEYESYVASLVCGYANTIHTNFEKTTNDNAIITGLNINLNEYMQRNTKGECYSILKIAHENVIGKLPTFSSLTEVYKYKKENKGDLRSLRNELSNLEQLIRSADTSAILKAEKDIKLAAKSLRNNSTYSHLSKWITYISVPVAVAEVLLNSSFAGIALTGAGVLLQVASDYSKRNNWITLLRN